MTTSTTPGPAEAARAALAAVAVAPPRRHPSRAARAAVAALVAALAVALTVVLAPALPHGLFVIAFAAVSVAAWYGGAWPGLLAAVLCVLGVDYFVIPPVGGLRPTDPADYVPMGVFVAVAWLTGTLTDAHRRALDSAEAAGEELAAANAQLQDQALELELSNQQLQEQAAELEVQTDELQATAGELEERTTEAERAGARAAFLAEASRLLGASLDPALTLEQLAALSVPVLADWCAVDIVDSATGAIEQVAVAHTDPRRVAWARQLRRDYPAVLDARAGAPAVVRTGRAEFYPEVTDAMLEASARDAAHLARMREIGMSAVIIAPIAARGRTLGALSLVGSGPARRFTADDLAFAEEVGLRAGLALDNARLHADEQAARARAEESERRFRETADAAPVLMWTAGADGRGDWVNAPWLTYTGRPLPALLDDGWAEDLHPDDVERCAATYRSAFAAREPFSMEYRLRRRDGAYRWFLNNGVPRYAADGSFVGYIGTAVDVSDQRAAREAAEGAARRVAYLAEASARLAGSLDVEATLRTLAALAVPALADWSFVEVLEGGRVRTAAVAHTVPEMVRHAYELLERYPIDLDASFGTGKVLRTGEPELNPDIPDEALVAVAQDPAHLAALRQIGFRSSLSVPLLDPDGRAVAVLSLVSAESGRRHDEADLTMAQEVARRAAAALASARLYAAGQAALRRAVALQEVSGALAGALTADEVARVVVHHGRAAVGAAAGSFFALTHDGGTFEMLASEGYDDRAVAAFARFPVVAGRPLSDAVLGDALTHVASLEDAEARYPEMTPALRGTGYEALAALPVRSGRRPVGALSLSFAERRTFDVEDGAFLETLVAQAGQALERARLVAAERAARAEAERANGAKTEFLATMSHELRTPLNAIGGYAELLALGVRGPVNDAQRQDLERLRRANQHLTGLVTDILNFARLDAGQVEYHVEDVELGPLVADLETLVGPQLAAKALAFDLDGCAPDTPDRPHAVRADAEKVRQVLLNLLTNAVKFTDRGGRIALACASDRAGGVIRLRVSDTGRGVPADQLSRIFEPFVQVDRHRTPESQQGVGLGLAISRDLARGMGGDLTVESTPGVGSTFTLTLPRA